MNPSNQDGHVGVRGSSPAPLFPFSIYETGRLSICLFDPVLDLARKNFLTTSTKTATLHRCRPTLELIRSLAR